MISTFAEGYPIEEPKIVIPWHIDPQQLISILKDRVDKVTRKYYTTKCISMKGLAHNLGFHFSENKLVEFELFRNNKGDLKSSYEEFQKHLTEVFGNLTSQSNGYEGYVKYDWLFPQFQVVHMVMDRFGPEEHVRIHNFA